MGIIDLLLIAVALSMDAFAVAVCKGLSVQKLNLKNYCIIGLWFGGFQALMPFIGYLLGSAFEKYIISIDHWIAFSLLSLIGINMIKEALSDEEEECSSFAASDMFPMAVATSIDALAIGVTFALLPDVDIGVAISFIGVITFVISALGLKIGNIFGGKYKSKAEIAGGIILILMGLKILFEHLNIISF